MTNKTLEKWEEKTLEEVCTFSRGLTYSKKDEVEFSKNVVLRANNIDLETNSLNFEELKFLNENFTIPADKKVRANSIMICISSGSKSHLGKVAFIDKDYGYAFGGFMGLLTPQENIVPKYLYYMLTTPSFKNLILNLTDGANINNLKYTDLKNFRLNIPSQAEQQRIVDILDKAFEKIKKAEQNSLHNLNYAKELFECKVEEIFKFKNKPIIDTNFSKEFKIKSGDFLSSQKMNLDGKYYVYGGNGINGKHNIFNYSGENIIIGRVGEKCGNIHYVSQDVWVTDNAFVIAETTHNFDKKFLYYFLTKLNLRQYATKTTHPVISGKSLKDVRLIFPTDIQEQQKIVAQLDELQEQVKKLEQIYEQKIKDLDELKQSILQKAFNGDFSKRN